MTYLQTEYFLSVAHTKSITRSAAELFVSPPAVSKQISLLEQELGFQLFIRSPRGMTITPAGETMYNHFYSQKESFDLAIKRVRSLESAVSPDLHLGIMEGWALTGEMCQLKEHLLSLTQQTHLRLHHCFDPSGGSFGALERGELDAVICLSEDIQSSRRELCVVPLTRIRKVFLFSSRSPLAQKADLQPKDFAGLPLISFSAEVRSAARQENLALCSDLGLEPRTLITDSLDSALLRVGMGDGFLIGDEWMEKVCLPGYAHLLLPAVHNVSLAWWRHNRNPALPALVEYCTRQMRWPSRVEDRGEGRVKSEE